MSWGADAKVYVGGLPTDSNLSEETRIKRELEDHFGRYGRLRKVWVARRPPGFGFVEFEDVRDAEDAVRALDGTRMCGIRARVELSHGRRRGGRDEGGRGGRGGGGYGDRNGYDRRRSPSPRRGGGRRSRSRSRSRSPPPRRSDSRSPPPKREPKSRSPSRSRSRSK